MTKTYKHTQIGYLMIGVTIAILVLFVRTYITTAAEIPSIDSGNNMLTTATMAIVLFILVSFWSLHVHIDQKYLRIKFSYGIFKKNFPLDEIVSAKAVQNPRYTGWGIRRRIGHKIWIYNVSGFDAVEIQLKNGKHYRIGTDEPKKLEQAILHALQ